MAEAIDDTFNVEEEFMDALSFLQREYRRRVKEQGAKSVAAVRIKGLIVALLHDRGDYAETLKAAFDLYWRRVKVLGLIHPSTVENRFLIMDLLRDHGTPRMRRQIYPHAVRTFRILERYVKKIFRKGRYDRALREGIAILEDVMMFFQEEDHPVSFDLASTIAMVYAETEDYASALEIIQDVYSKRCKLKYEEHEEPDLRGMAATLMKKGYILLKMCRYKDALDCYIGAQQIRQAVYGTFHQKTVAASLGVAEVCYTVGNFDFAKVVLRCAGKFQKKMERPEILYTYIHNGNLEFSRGNYRHALAIYRKAAAVKKAPLRVRAAAFRQMGALFCAMGRYTRANRALHLALNMILRTEFHVDELIIYRYKALVMQKLRMFATAQGGFETLIQICERTMSCSHSVLLTIERDLGELFFSMGQKAEAMDIFRRLLDFLNNTPERTKHPDTMKVKCQVAKVLASTKRHTDALALYGEVVPVLAGYFYPQHRDRILIDIKRGSVYWTQGYCDKAFALYYKSYEVIAENYGANHRYTKKMIRMIMNISPKEVLPGPMIEAAQANSTGSALIFAACGEDLDVRDLKGAVPLHYAAREGYEGVVRCLLGKGAIYNAKDLAGNTPQSYIPQNIEQNTEQDTAKNKGKKKGKKKAKNTARKKVEIIARNEALNSTRFMLILIDSMFECVKKNEVSKFRKMVKREPLIINARDSQNRTLLQWAIALYHLDILKVLIDNGADLTLANEEEGTALHMAAERGHANIMSMLLQKHLATHRLYFSDYIDSRENFMCATAMHLVAKNDDYHCMAVLTHYQADPLITDLFGKYPHDMGTMDMSKHLDAYTDLYLLRVLF